MDSPSQVFELVNKPQIEVAIYIISSVFIQLGNKRIFVDMKPWSYILSPIAAMLPGNLIMLLFGIINNSDDTNIFIALSHVVIALVVLNYDIANDVIIFVSGTVCSIFNSIGLVAFSRLGAQYGLVGQFVGSYLPLVLFGWLYLYCVVSFMKKNTKDLYVSTKQLIRNSITFTIIFSTAIMLDAIHFYGTFLVILGLYFLVFIDSTYYHKLDSFYKKAKLD